MPEAALIHSCGFKKTRHWGTCRLYIGGMLLPNQFCELVQQALECLCLLHMCGKHNCLQWH